MIGAKELRWLLLGFAAATLAAAAAGPRPASAQEADPGRTVPPVAAEAPAPGASDDAAPDGAGAETVLRDGDGEDAGEDEDAGDPARARPGQRPVAVDGDLRFPREPEAPIDGAPDEPEPEGPIDGIDPSAVDTRAQEDIDVFENPPAGFDPLLFQIEEVEPILDRRPDRLFRFEPLDPVGVKLGSFVYFPEARLSGVHDSNLFRTPTRLSDQYLELETSSRLVSNWSVHALELRTDSTFSFHNEFDSENAKDYLVEGRGRLDIRRGTNLQGAVSHSRTQESRSAIDASATGDPTPIDTTQGNAALTHRFNRLEAQLRASIADIDFGEADDGTGTIVTNDERDTRVHEQAVRLTYQLKPSFAVFAEGGLNQRDYRAVTISDGFFRDSDGQRYRFGLDFGSEGQILRGQLGFGYGQQDPDEVALETVDGFLFDADVVWRVTELTALRLTGRTDILDTTTANSGGVLSHEVGLEARHAFRRYFIGTAGVVYSRNEFATVGIEEDQWRTYLDAEYFANREISLFGRYEHTSFSSSEPDEDYDASEVRVGVRVRR